MLPQAVVAGSLAVFCRLLTCTLTFRWCNVVWVVHRAVKNRRDESRRRQQPRPSHSAVRLTIDNANAGMSVVLQPKVDRWHLRGDTKRCTGSYTSPKLVTPPHFLTQTLDTYHDFWVHVLQEVVHVPFLNPHGIIKLRRMSVWRDTYTKLHSRCFKRSLIRRCYDGGAHSNGPKLEFSWVVWRSDQPHAMPIMSAWML